VSSKRGQLIERHTAFAKQGPHHRLEYTVAAVANGGGSCGCSAAEFQQADAGDDRQHDQQ
jgi:hypothetical protein